MLNSQTGLVSYKSTLEIRKVSKMDYDYYDCEVYNTMGKTMATIQFTAPTNPKPPLRLSVS